ncbi:MAG: sugar phosphate isomerase/epimerase [Selenomonadaceae bacterium]|nr:sugar phosphate isomerase/epimerase [Selenomonadaceae bacterium]
MLKLGVQTQNAVSDKNPAEGFKMISDAGFSCVDFSLHGYLLNKDIYQGKINDFFDKSIDELEDYFKPHKLAAQSNNITIHQMHMPYPMYVPAGKHSINEYLRSNVAMKSMQLCKYLECRYIVIHGFKMESQLGSEAEEWNYTESFLETILPFAKENNITICVENLYSTIGGHLIEGPCCKVNRIAERIDRINDKYQADVLGFCLDTGHANLVGLDFETFINALGSRLKVLHIHDNDGVRDLHQIPFTFARTRENTCSTDWNGFIRGLQDIHYDGVLNFETGPVLKSFPAELKPNALKFIAEIGKYFASNLI